MTPEEHLDAKVIAGTGESGLGATQSMNSSEAEGAMIGRYRLLQRIGEGGMGEVWLAEQKEPVHRRVALKLVKGGVNSREVVARFESERQALALMDHPAIAKVFDAGATPEGVPYFVMEYIAGVSITSYCDEHRLTTGERLELFLRVCEGVQHAHQKAIIHRDLKPSNILVTELDGKPAPKIIDFGVAKALTQKLTAETMFTRLGAVVGTPEYMSPEQANSAGEDIDTRSDVYSLGVIFYELLAGAPPIDLRKIAFDELLRRLRDEEPSKPSTKIRTQNPATSTEVARKRRTEPLALAKQFRGDLDAIALKALEKDRSRRYGSPSDFAADIGRYLNNQTVLAVPPSAGYRAGKFARRYRGALITACAFALMLILASTISIWQSVRAAKQRDRADREAAAAQAVIDFLQNDLLSQASAAGQSGKNIKPDPDLKVRTALDRAAAGIAGKFDRQPELEAAIRFTIGLTYKDLGVYPQAQMQLDRALEVQRRVLGVENPKTLKTMNTLGVVLALQGKYADAEALFRQVVDTRRSLLGPDHPDTLAGMSNLINIYDVQGKYEQTETLDRQTLASRRRVLGPEHHDTLQSMQNLGVDYQKQGKYAEAEALDTQILEVRRRVLGPEHPETLFAMTNLAGVYQNQGKYAQADALENQVLEIGRHTLGPENPDTLQMMNRLAQTYSMLGKYTQAEALFNQTLEIQRRVLGAENPATLGTLSNLAFMYQRQGKYSLAESYATEALAGKRHRLGSNYPATVNAAADLALAYLSQGKYAASEPLASEALTFDRNNQSDDWQRFRAETLLGASLAGQKKYAEGEPLLVGGYQGMLTRKDRIASSNRYHLDSAREWLVQMYQAWGKPAKAAEWREK